MAEWQNTPPKRQCNRNPRWFSYTKRRQREHARTITRLAVIVTLVLTRCRLFAILYRLFFLSSCQSFLPPWRIVLVFCIHGALVVLPSRHISSCPLVVLLSCHLIVLLFCHPVVILSRRLIVVPSCCSVILSYCRHIVLSSNRRAVLSSCRIVVILSCRLIVVPSYCSVVQSYCCYS